MYAEPGHFDHRWTWTNATVALHLGPGLHLLLWMTSAQCPLKRLRLRAQTSKKLILCQNMEAVWYLWLLHIRFCRRSVDRSTSVSSGLELSTRSQRHSSKAPRFLRSHQLMKWSYLAARNHCKLNCHQKSAPGLDQRLRSGPLAQAPRCGSAVAPSNMVAENGNKKSSIHFAYMSAIVGVLRQSFAKRATYLHPTGLHFAEICLSQQFQWSHQSKRLNKKAFNEQPKNQPTIHWCKGFLVAGEPSNSTK